MIYISEIYPKFSVELTDLVNSSRSANSWWTDRTPNRLPRLLHKERQTLVALAFFHGLFLPSLQHPQVSNSCQKLTSRQVYELFTNMTFKL